MKLLDLCEPIFHYVCKVNRIARNQGHLDFVHVRADIKELLSQAASRAQNDVALASQYKKIRLPLIFFIDSMIVESGASCASDWEMQRLAEEENILGGDEAFYEYLEDAMADTGPDAAEILLFYYTCLGLGFTGLYFGQSDMIQQKMKELAVRLRPYLGPDLSSKIMPEAYEHTDTRDLVQPPAPRIIGMIVAFGVMAVVVLVAMVFLYFSASNQLATSITSIVQKTAS